MVLAVSVGWSVDNVQVADTNRSVENGPTLNLGYNGHKNIENPIFSFMYFVPLISPTLVQSHISPENTLKVAFDSYKMEKDGKSFEVVYKFDIGGEGIYNNIFNPDHIIEWNTEYDNNKDKKGGKLTKLLEYIKFEGQGVGRCEIKGRMEKGQPVVEQVKVHFNDKDSISPVTVGIYDITPDCNGNYDFDKRFNKVVARVNTLTFNRDKKDGEELPRMDIKLACVGNEEDCEGLWASVKGKFANLFIKPIAISEKGNDSMIDFGTAIVHQKSSFTFPVAENLVGGAPVVAMISKSKDKIVIDD